MLEMKRIELLVAEDLVEYNLIIRKVIYKMSLKELEKRFMNIGESTTIENSVQNMLLTRDFLLESELNDISAEEQLTIIRPIIAVLLQMVISHIVVDDFRTDGKTEEEILKKLKELGLVEDVEA